MALSLHAEYLLGYLAGAKNLAPRDVAPFAGLDPADRSPQGVALVKALALGVTDGRRSLPVRDASAVRVRVLAMLSQKSGGASTGPSTGELPAATIDAALTAPRESDPNVPVDEYIARAVEGR